MRMRMRMERMERMRAHLEATLGIVDVSNPDGAE